MGKHSKVKEKKKISTIKVIIFIIFTVAIGIGIYFFLERDNPNQRESNINHNLEKTDEKLENANNIEYDSISDDTSIENECLVMKSLSDYNKIIEYTFKGNILDKIIIYEEFKAKKEFESKVEIYKQLESMEILEIDEEKMSIEIEKKDKGTDEDLSYQEIYDKYLVHIVGGYEQL